jgi:hypothetical protein
MVDSRSIYLRGPAQAGFSRVHSSRPIATLWIGCLEAIFLALCFILFSSSASAASFELLRGGRYELCREFAANLKRFPNLSRTTEEWPLGPGLKDFTKPKWEVLDIGEHLDVIKKLFLWNWGPGRQVGSDTPEEIWERHSKEVYDGLAKGTARLERARYDFDNDGHLDTVYRFYNQLPVDLRNSWRTKQIGGYWYVYFSDHDQEAAEHFRPYSAFDQFYDSFFFKGRSYLIGWLDFLSIYELATIPTRHELVFTEACRFNAKP